eukprot:scaffold121323_cov40-Prasinocladus_malaysianus.AAC.1
MKQGPKQYPYHYGSWFRLMISLIIAEPSASLLRGDETQATKGSLEHAFPQQHHQHLHRVAS